MGEIRGTNGRREKTDLYRVWLGKLNGKEHLRHLGVDWRIIFKLVWLGIGTSGAGVVDALMQVAVSPTCRGNCCLPENVLVGVGFLRGLSHPE